MPRTCLAAIAAVAALASPTAQEPQRPVFRSAVERVPVDVIVVDEAGRPVIGLTAEDFRIAVDGRPRQVVSAEYVPQVSPTAAARAVSSAPAARDVPMAASNATQAVGRLLAIVADLEHMRAGTGREVVSSIGRFLDRLQPDDRVALMTVPFGGPRVDFTVEHDRVREGLGLVAGRSGMRPNEFGAGVVEALAIVRGDRRTEADVVARECEFARFPESCPTRVLNEARAIARDETQGTRDTLEALTRFTRALQPIEGPKTILLMSEGLVRTNENRVYFERFASAAAAARVNLYVVSLPVPTIEAAGRLRTIQATQDADLKADSLEDLTGMARGALFRMSGTGEGIFDRIAVELSGYYLLSFEPQGADRDGRAHAIKVTTTRPGVDLRARSEFVVGGASEPSRVSPPDPRSELTSMLRTPRVLADLPLSVAAYTVRHTDPSRVKVVLAAEVGSPGAVDPQAIDLGFEIARPDGTIVADAIDHQVLTARDSLTPPSYVGAAVVEPGSYRLKLAAIDDAGRCGTVDMRLDARLVPAGPLRLSDLLLGTTRGETFVPSIAPLTTASAVAAHLEIYAASPAAPHDLRVLVELAPDVRAPAIASEEAQIEESDDPTRLIAQVTLRIDTVRSGDFIVRAIVLVDGEEAGRVSRALRRQ